MMANTRLDPMKDRRTPEMSPGLRCDAMVDTGRSVNYSCTLPRGHSLDEPHYALESAKAVRRWQEWASNREIASRVQVEVVLCDYQVDIEGADSVLGCLAPVGHEGPHMPVVRDRVVPRADGSVNLYEDGLLALINLTTFFPRGYQLTDVGHGSGDFVLTKIADNTTVDISGHAEQIAKAKALMP
jgi:hypothetical protein